MSRLLGFILIIVGIALIFVFIYGKSFLSVMKNGKSRIKNKRAHREETINAMDEIMKLFDTKKKIQNDDVESLLKVSDSTATRYLDRLQEEDKIEQIGEQGRGVFYRKK